MATAPMPQIDGKLAQQNRRNRIGPVSLRRSGQMGSLQMGGAEGDITDDLSR